jgi:mono/diheme cytochrome c family protein
MRSLARHSVLIAVLLSASGPLVPSHAKDTSYATIERGRHLVNAGDCIACHTADKGKSFAGGRAIETPFGTIYSPNITPDRETGIGAWSEEDFYRALHSGIGPDGTHLYPAFPYPYFTKMTYDDVQAMFAYLKTLAPVKNEHRAADLTWPLGYRFLMRGWNWMYFDEGTFKPNPQKSAEWNRGAYLVQGPAHCGACHTPKTLAGADDTDNALQGGQIQNWFAPKIANDTHNGTGGWNIDDIVEYLKTGRNKHSGATGLMAEVVANSTSKLPDADLHAIAVYLKDFSGQAPESSSKPDTTVMNAGQAIFADSCSGCHQVDGKGVPRMFPPLVHNANAQSKDPTSVIRVILHGAQTVATDKRPTPFTMPAFDWKLSDGEIAAVASYVRNAWGNSAPAVSADQVKSLRHDLQAKTN